MTLALRILFAMLSVLPSVPSIIQHVETAANGKSTGDEKKAAATSLVQDTIGVVANVAPGQAATAQAVGAGANALVQSVFDVLKATGALHETKAGNIPPSRDMRPPRPDSGPQPVPPAAVSQADGHAGDTASQPDAAQNASTDASAHTGEVNHNGDPVFGK